MWNYKDAGGNWQSKLLVSNDYTYDTAGQRLTNLISSLDPQTGTPTSRTETYGYDELNRLGSVNYGDGQTQSYTFDSMGNRLTKSDSVNGSESYVVNAANMLTNRTVGGTTSAYTNDLDGNTLTGGGRTNTWDSDNRLTKCVYGTNTSAFTYGSDGIRRRSVVNGVSTDFVLDANMFIRELHTDPQTLLTSVKATYFMGASGPAYRRDDAGSGTVRWYLYDGLGSVLGAVDPNGTITARRKYDVYGSIRAGSDAGASKHKFVGGLGHPSEDETGLTYMRARYYDPTVGRFISEDKQGCGNNWFAYCENNPVNFADATGAAPSTLDILTGVFVFGFIAGFGAVLWAEQFAGNPWLNRTGQGVIWGLAAVISYLVTDAGLVKLVSATLDALKALSKLLVYGIGVVMVTAIAAYSGALIAEMALDAFDDATGGFLSGDPSEGNGILPW